MTASLTDEEIAELRQTFAPVGRGDVVTITMTRGEYDSLRRLLDEVEHGREIRRGVAACPPEHTAEHAAWCGGCCAKFDPGRMVLVHAVDCKFRGHERAER